MKRIIFVTILLLSMVAISGCTDTGQLTSLNQSLSEANVMIAQQEQQITELNQEIYSMNEFNKYYTQGFLKYDVGDYNRVIGDYDYGLWSWYYEQGYYADSIDYCVEARDAYIISNNNYGSAKANFEEANKTAKGKYIELIDYYIQASEKIIEINWAMYEACEYFESASNYYSQELWDTGDEEIERANEKIVMHDSLVIPFNEIAAKIDVIEENL